MQALIKNLSKSSNFKSNFNGNSQHLFSGQYNMLSLVDKSWIRLLRYFKENNNSTYYYI